MGVSRHERSGAERISEWVGWFRTIWQRISWWAGLPHDAVETKRPLSYRHGRFSCHFGIAAALARLCGGTDLTDSVPRVGGLVPIDGKEHA